MRRYRCADCGHVWRQDTSAAAEPRAKLSRTGLRWALEGIVVAHLTVARVAEGLRPGTSNGPTEALNGRLEHLRGSALGFRNLTNYIARSLLETGGFRPRLLHPRLG
ncbi:hypothetical protein GCM10022294_20320 [Dietzia aurantiaca]